MYLYIYINIYIYIYIYIYVLQFLSLSNRQYKVIGISALKRSILEHLEIKDFLCHQPWWGQGLDSLDNLCIPEPGHYIETSQIQILYWPPKV